MIRNPLLSGYGKGRRHASHLTAARFRLHAAAATWSVGSAGVAGVLRFAPALENSTRDFLAAGFLVGAFAFAFAGAPDLMISFALARVAPENVHEPSRVFKALLRNLMRAARGFTLSCSHNSASVTV